MDVQKLTHSKKRWIWFAKLDSHKGSHVALKSYNMKEPIIKL